MTDAPRLLAFAGSARRESFNKKLIRVAAASAERHGAAVTLIDLRDYPMPLYDGDLEASEGLPAHCLTLRDMLKAHQAMLIATPEYNGSIPPLLKNTFDWISRPYQGENGLDCFRDKVVGLLSASPGRLGAMRALAHMRVLLTTLGCIVHPSSHSIAAAREAFGPDGEIADADTLARIGRVVEATIKLARQTAA
jgi:NAD(P)H-dependent FMN reductase